VKLNTSFRAEQGSAIIDFLGFGVLLQIPILMFATFAVQSQQQSFAVEAIARHALRAFVLSPERLDTNQVIAELIKDFGIDAEAVDWRITCSPDPRCQGGDSIVKIEVQIGELIATSSSILSVE
jgi:hypothetical protein